MNVKLRVLSAGAIFFLGIAANAQKKKADTTTKTNDIEEVVVLGTYGIKETQEQKVGSYSLVTSKTLERPNALSVDMAIAGQVSGTIINANSGQPGSNAKVLIRGVSSLTGNNQPLYIVDGVPVLIGDQAGVATTSNALAMIDPTDIESVEVLKDGATTSIYGSRAAAGVIIIKTKSGKGGKGKLTLMAEYGYGTPAFEKLKFQSAQEQVNTLIKGYMAIGQSLTAATNTVLGAEGGLLRGWDGVTNTDWEKATRRSVAGASKYNLNYSFGNEKIKGYASIGNTEQEGITRDALYKRMNATIKLDAKINDKVSIVSSNMISRATQFGPLDYGYFANPILNSRFTPNTNSVYNADGSYNLSINGGVGNAGFNPVALQDVNKRKSSFTKILSSFGLNYSILKNLRFSSNLGIDYNYYDENEYNNPDFGDGVNPSANITGLAVQSNYTYTTLNWSNFFNYDFKINDDHKFTATAGTEATIHWKKFPYQASTGFKSGHYEQNVVSWGSTPYSTDSYETQYHLIGYIGRLSYGFKNYLNVMGSFRRDGYSHFGDNKKYGNFWATGANFNVHNIVNVSSVLDELKVRASYGEVGNTGGTSVMYVNKPTLGQSLYQLEGGYVISNPGNPNLQWESSKKSNIGLDLGFSNSFRVSFDIYKNIISDQLTPSIPNAPSTGFGSLVGNLLKSDSKGFESTFTYDAIKHDDFTWSLTGNYSYTRSKVLKIDAPYLDVTYLKRYAVGHDPSEWFLANYIGVDHSNGDALWYTDSSHTTISNGQTGSATINRDYVGRKSIPTHTAGLTNSFSYKKLTLSFLLTYQGDYSVYDLWGRYYDADGQDVGIKQVQDVVNAWSPDNTSSDRPQYRPGNSVAKQHSTRYLYKGDHIKLKSVELGFRLNKDDLKVKEINSVYFYLRGINVLTFAFDKNLKFDPESNSNYVNNYVGGSGIYDQTQPIMRQVMLGAVIDF